jgi:hypothetical protein
MRLREVRMRQKEFGVFLRRGRRILRAGFPPSRCFGATSCLARPPLKILKDSNIKHYNTMKSILSYCINVDK